MTTPQFILDLREKIGTSELWIPGTTAIVLRNRHDPVGVEPGWSRALKAASDVEVLCVRRADNGWWTPITGIVDPREAPAVAAQRETFEEAAVRARVDRLIGVDVVGPLVYENGDRASYLDTAFVLEWSAGEPRPADGENTEALFMCADALPQMNPRFTRLIAKALSSSLEADFAV